MEDRSVADAMNSALYLAPELVGDAEVDPLLDQAFQNVEDDAEDYEDAAAARRAPPLPPPPTPEPRKFDPESTPEFRAMVVELVTVLGRRYVAVLGGAGATGELADWIHGYAMPQQERADRLRLAYKLVQTLRNKPLDDKRVEQWFVARNDALGGRMPIEVLYVQPPASVSDSLMKAAASA